MTIRFKVLFFLILFLTSFLRLYKFTSIPSSLNWDEISHAYNAYSLIHTQKDQWGVSWPIFNFRAYGDYPTTANMYLTLPFIHLFGINEFSTRLPSVIFGIIFVILCYFLGLIIQPKNKALALILMFLAAISPWTLFPSRAVFQSNISQTLTLLGVILLMKSLDHLKFLPLSVFFLSISMYAYHNSRIVVPILLLVFIFLYKDKLLSQLNQQKTHLIFSALIFLIISIPSLINLFSPESRARSRWVSIINQNSINIIEENRNHFVGPYFLNRLINNKLTYFVPRFFANYLQFVNPKLLFFTGSEHYQFNVPNHGILYSVEIGEFFVKKTTNQER